MMENCIFCKISSGLLPAYKIFENDKYLAFLDISQFTPGHTLVIPKKHYETVWDCEDISEYLEICANIARHYKELGYKYIDSSIWGRGVNHAHVHLIPHNNDNEEYNNALIGLNTFTESKTPRINPEMGTNLVNKLKYE